MTTTDEYVPSEGDVRAWCREGTGDYPDVMDEWITRFLTRVRRDAAHEALDGLLAHAEERCGLSKSHRARDDWNTVAGATQDYRDTYYPEGDDQ